VIGTNKKDAADTVAKILADREAGRLDEAVDVDRDAIADWLAARVPGLVTWEGGARSTATSDRWASPTDGPASRSCACPSCSTSPSAQRDAQDHDPPADGRVRVQRVGGGNASGEIGTVVLSVANDYARAEGGSPPGAARR
jgi:hypothetical protein